jgi:uncharacterized protein YqgC (DUF456 family)
MDLLAVAALSLMALGLAGLVIPGIPAVAFVFGAALLYSLVSGFEEFGVGWLLLMAAIAGAATVFDFIAAPALARRFGASKWGVLGAIIGLVAGLIFGGPLGALIGPLIGAVALELIFGRELRQALRSGLGTAVGFVATFVVDATASLAIIGLFLVLVIV